MHFLNTGVQFSIEKYFRAVFDKLKKSISDFRRFRVFRRFLPRTLARGANGDHREAWGVSDLMSEAGAGILRCLLQ